MGNEEEFNNIISDIIKSEKFNKLKDEKHHGITRREHSINVAKVTYMLAKRMHMKNYKELTRASLLHDLFEDYELVGKVNLLYHPKVAAKNAKKLFNINEMEYNIIESHMFPTVPTFPKYKESWVLVGTDKLVAIYEMLRYKLPLKMGLSILYIISFINIPLNK